MHSGVQMKQEYKITIEGYKLPNDLSEEIAYRLDLKYSGAWKIKVEKVKGKCQK
jgi:hypothetical protein